MTLLNLPSYMLPDVVLLDEPELGLHPAAIGLIAGMIKQRSMDRQIIVATHDSPDTHPSKRNPRLDAELSFPAIGASRGQRWSSAGAIARSCGGEYTRSIELRHG